MRPLMLAFCLAIAATPLAHAQQTGQDTGKAGSTERKPTAKQQAQRDRMKDCNAEAGARKGDERKQFMSACLSEERAGAKKGTAQQERMKDCNRQASERSMKGDERKQFMSSCLKGG